MAATNTYTIHSVSHNGAQLGGNSSQSIDPTTQKSVLMSDGDTEITYQAIMSQDPQVPWSSNAVKSVIDALGLSGSPISSDDVFFFKQRINMGKVESGAKQFKTTVAQGLTVPKSIAASQGQEATVQVTTHAIYDGSNSPFEYANNQTAPGSVGTQELFTVGPCILNGVQFPGIQSINLDTGVEVVMNRGDGDAWPTFITIRSIKPVMTINFLDPVMLDTLGLCGTKAIPANQTEVYLRGIENMNKPYADAALQHIRFDFKTCLILPQNASGQQEGDATISVMIEGINDGTNAPLTVATGVAIDFTP